MYDSAGRVESSHKSKPLLVRGSLIRACHCKKRGLQKSILKPLIWQCGGYLPDLPKGMRGSSTYPLYEWYTTSIGAWMPRAPLTPVPKARCPSRVTTTDFPTDPASVWGFGFSGLRLGDLVLGAEIGVDAFHQRRSGSGVRRCPGRIAETADSQAPLGLAANEKHDPCDQSRIGRCGDSRVFY